MGAARVFIIEPVSERMNLKPAEFYGDLTYVFGPSQQRVSLFDCVRYQAHLLLRLEELAFNPAVDSVCAVGSSVALMQCVAAILGRYHWFNVLFYSSTEMRYIKRELGRKE